jgi:hypothetical protein
MKTKLLVAASAAIIGTGAFMHTGHKPRCLMQLFSSGKPAVTNQASFASVQDQGHDPKNKKKKHKNLKTMAPMVKSINAR